MLQCNMAGRLNVTNCNGGNFPMRHASNPYQQQRNGRTKQLQFTRNFMRYATSNAYQMGCSIGPARGYRDWRLMMKKAISADGTKVMFTFEGLAPVEFDPTKASETNRNYAAMHGWMARIGDNAAIQKSAENGYVVTEAMRREAVLELVNHYHSGTVDWSPKQRVKTVAQNPHILAIAAKRGCSYEDAQAWFTAKLMAELGAMDGSAEAPRG